jgi:NDP-sugar pyrophosphorylase family protein
MTHVIIPMSGLGQRFKKAGYERPKPLIEVDGRPMIEYVVSMFSRLDRFTFICNEEHLASTDLQEVLESLVPGCDIRSIATHHGGPVSAVVQCLDILDDEETIVNYCDFYSLWNYQDFLSTVRREKVAGAVVAYRNFHPHMLGTDNYAFIKACGMHLEAIQEKQPFTDHRMSEFASNGTYYFSRGQYVAKYFERLIERDIQVNGEYYVSMVYNLMVEDSLPVDVYEVDYMLQWGTPRDLEEYQHWSHYFFNLQKSPPGLLPTVDICLIPMAGRGARFSAEGYTVPKPLIEVGGAPMVVLATGNLPRAARYIFAALQEHLTDSDLADVLNQHFDNVSIVPLSAVSRGQADTCLQALLKVRPDVPPEASLLIGACDNGMIYNHERWRSLMATDIDVIVFSFRNHPASSRNPHMFGWLKVAGDFVTGVSVKQQVSATPALDHAVVGAFYIRRSADFIAAATDLIERDITVNGEFYVDSMVALFIERGLKCAVFPVDDYISFGIPDDLRTYKYWQSFFRQCWWHQPLAGEPKQ